MPSVPAIASGDGGPTPRPRERLTAAQRLRTAADFDEIRRLGRRVETGPFTLRLRLRPQGPRRLGVIASRRAGPAVSRNRAKRVLRELFRRNLEALPVSCDVVVIVRANFFEHTFEAMREFYLRAVRQAGTRRRDEAKDKRPE
jgi:ribonuclease P protein component